MPGRTIRMQSGMFRQDDPKRCEVCDLRPRMWRWADRKGFAACVGCGLISRVADSGDGADFEPAAVLSAPWLVLLRQFWQDHHQTIVLPEFWTKLEDFERVWYSAQLAYLDAHRSQWPEPMVSRELVQVFEIRGTTAVRRWDRLGPDGVLGTDRRPLTLDPSSFPVGTTVTIVQPGRQREGS